LKSEKEEHNALVIWDREKAKKKVPAGRKQVTNTLVQETQTTLAETGRPVSPRGKGRQKKIPISH
jgi:hypothetical protein